MWSQCKTICGTIGVRLDIYIKLEFTHCNANEYRPVNVKSITGYTPMIREQIN